MLNVNKISRKRYARGTGYCCRRLKACAKHGHLARQHMLATQVFKHRQPFSCNKSLYEKSSRLASTHCKQSRITNLHMLTTCWLKEWTTHDMHTCKNTRAHVIHNVQKQGKVENRNAQKAKNNEQNQLCTPPITARLQHSWNGVNHLKPTLVVYFVFLERSWQEMVGNNHMLGKGFYHPWQSSKT